MVKKIINIGIEGNDATGDPIRDAFEKTNENFNELYSLFGKGDGIGFADLTDYDPDRNGELVSNSIFIVNNSGDPNIPGSKILAKKLVGDNIEIINTDPDTITIKNTGSRLSGDAAPRLSAPLNADGNLIYNVKDATLADSTGLGVELTAFAASQGYVGSNFVGLDGDAMRGPLTVPAGASGNQVPRRNEVVGLAGDTMTGPLKLSRNPVPSDDIDYNGLIAATKQYVDTTSFSSQVNLFVSAASGNDFRFDVPEAKRGSALAYAFKTINRACFKAEQLINAAEIELGPYQKPIFYNNGNDISRAVSVTGPKTDLITFTLTISNAGGQFGTDMRGNSLSSTAAVDIRAGLVIRGTTSGALAMITLIDPTIGTGGTFADGFTYGGTEKYEFIYKNFSDAAKTQPVTFITGETLEYADSIQKLNITIFLESGEYYENYPIRVPTNVTIVGDDTRRVIIKPKTGPSGSIWSDLYFRRDITIDGLTVVTPVTAGNFVVGQIYTIASLGTTSNDQWKTIAGTTGQTITYKVNDKFTAYTTGIAGTGVGTAYCEFGYHYLKNPSKKLYNNPINLIDTINNPSNPRYANAQFILNANRTFLQNEIVAYVTATYPGSYSQPQQDSCYRDVGSIIDAFGFDLTYGNYSRTLEVAMSYYTNASSLSVITGDQLVKTVAMITRLETIVRSAIQTQLITRTTGNTSIQNTTFSFAAEAGAGTVVSSLVRLLLDIINKNETVVNFPKDNNQQDVFLLNDTTRLRTISAQGHGGFMAVLDPAGQILTKSPYVFQCSSFTRSTNKQQFAGGLFVDAFTGNLSCKVVTSTYSVSTKVTTVRVTGLVFRTPTNLPVSFMITGKRFEVDWIDQSSGYSTGEYNLYLNSNTPDNVIYTGVTQILTTNLVIELETAGNRSMLCSDFTQINDLGYGICASNGSYIEAVSIFTYYCYRGFYSLNGSQIRSLNGSCAFGTYALSSEGSDPTEVSTTANLRYPTIQILTTYSAGDFSLTNLKSNLTIFVRVNKKRNINYVPFSSSELEIRHSDILTGRYFVSNSSPATVIVGGNTVNLSIDNDDIYQLSLSSSGNSNTLTTGLVADVPDATPVIVRVLKNFAVVQLTNANPTRPSTALQFNNDSNIYHLSAYTETPITIIATSASSGNVINVTPGSTVGLITGQEIKFTTGVSFSTNILLNTTYFINTITLNSFKLSSSREYAIANNSIVVSASPSVIIQTILITGAFEITTSAFTNAWTKGTSILIPLTSTGISGIIPGNTYYLAADVLINGTLIKLSASYSNAIQASPTMIQVSGTPGGDVASRTIVLGKYLEGTVGSAKDLSSVLSIESNYDYVTLSPKSGAIGDTQINIEKLSVTNQSRIVGMIFAWKTTIHKITSYLPAGIGTGKSGSTEYDTILFTNQLTKALAPSSYANVIQTLKAGINNLTSTNAQTGLILNSEISVMRASGHDLVDIGTGGFANSNIPTNIYGVSAIPKSQDNEVQEIGRGRVFYSTTDQDGNFKVGKYFQVDQGTGSVTFSASLSITGIDGLGFSRGGVTVKEFAADETMGQRSSDTVPTQSAVVGYIDRRLGLIHPGNSISSQKLGPGFLPLDGTATFGTTTNDRLDMGTHKIINLKAPENGDDATNKTYVDSFFKRAGSIRSGIDGFEMSDKTTFDIQSVARSANVATIVLLDSALRSGQHGLSVGSIVTISGANTPHTGFNNDLINVFWTVSEIVSATSFRFANTGADRSTTPVYSATVTTESNISMNGAKITNLLAPTAGSDAVNKTYVDAAVASKDQLSELSDVAVSSILDGQPLSYNTATSKWVNNQPIDQSKLSLRLAKTIGAKPSGLSVAAGNFQIGKTYIITDLGTTTQLQWNTIAGTTSITYSIGSIFNATIAGGNSGNGTAIEDIQANSGVASFNSTHFTIATDGNGFVSLADGGITLAKLDKIGTGYVIGNNSGADATPALVTFANALNSAITIPQGQTVAPAGVIAKASDATFSTILYSTTSTNNALVQRNDTGGITVGALSAGAITGSSLNVSTGNIVGGSITSGGIISAKSELQIDTKKLFGINGNVTELYNRVGLKVADFTGSLAPDTITGQLYGVWTINSITTGGAATAGTLTGNWSVSTVTTNALTTGAAATAGTITGNWSLGTGSQLRATYADLAEYYSSDNDYSAGTVVMIGGDQDVTLAKGYGNTAVAGVVSENPAYLMNAECAGIRVAIALQGRVLCKVVGVIKKGDLLVVSQVAGAATTSKDPKPGSIIGKALANYDSDRIGMIEVLVGKH